MKNFDETKFLEMVNKYNENGIGYSVKYDTMKDFYECEYKDDVEFFFDMYEEMYY